MTRIGFSFAIVCLLLASPAAAQQKKSAPAKAAGGAKPAGKSSSGPTSTDLGGASGGMCISPEAPKEVSSCPANMGKAKHKIAGAPTSQLRQSKRKVEQPKGFKAKGPSVELDLATLRNKDKVEQKAEGLLRREINVTQRLIKNTHTEDP